MNPRTLAIGDVHGCLTALDTLLESVNLQADDTLIFLGDYVDRGPDSSGVLHRLLELSTRDKTIFLRGNHDLWMERAQDDRQWFTSWFHPGVGGIATLNSYGNLTDVPLSHWEFLDNLVEYYETDTEIFVHGAVDAELEMLDQHQQVLLWDRIDNQAPHFSGKRIICGHTSQKSGLPLDIGHAVGIDTFCHGGGWLTALDVTTNRFWQANERGATRDDWL